MGKFVARNKYFWTNLSFDLVSFKDKLFKMAVFQDTPPSSLLPIFRSLSLSLPFPSFIHLSSP